MKVEYRVKDKAFLPCPVCGRRPKIKRELDPVCRMDGSERVTLCCYGGGLRSHDPVIRYAYFGESISEAERKKTCMEHWNNAVGIGKAQQERKKIPKW